MSVRENVQTSLETKDGIHEVVDKLFEQACNASPKQKNVHRKNAEAILSVLKTHLHRNPRDYKKVYQWFGSGYRITNWRNFLNLLYLSILHLDNKKLSNRLVKILEQDMKDHTSVSCPKRSVAAVAPSTTSLRQPSTRVPSSRHVSSITRQQQQRRVPSSTSTPLPWEVLQLPKPDQSPRVRSSSTTKRRRSSSSTSSSSQDLPWWETPAVVVPMNTPTPITTTSRRKSSQSKSKIKQDYDQFMRSLQTSPITKTTRKQQNPFLTKRGRSSSYPSDQQISFYM